MADTPNWKFGSLPLTEGEDRDTRLLIGASGYWRAARPRNDFGIHFSGIFGFYGQAIVAIPPASNGLSAEQQSEQEVREFSSFADHFPDAAGLS